jgi:hypothetical protein
MSVTSPTLKLLGLDELELDELLDPPLDAALELLLLLLLPQAATTRATATATSARRPIGPFLPFTEAPFLHNRMGNHIACGGPRGDSPNVLFT